MTVKDIAGAAPLPTAKQIAYIESLGGTVTDNMTRKSASQYIDKLIKERNSKKQVIDVSDLHSCGKAPLPKMSLADLEAFQNGKPYGETAKPKKHFPEIPAGRYVLEGPDGLAFFQVDQPKEGTRWYGWTFVKRLFGSPGDYRKVPVKGQEAREILTAIAADPKAAMKRYGHESGICGNCSSPLTDPESLARGLGPICAGNLGWKEG